jgi:glycosyltransferase involved in cell wall biosynthesis
MVREAAASVTEVGVAETDRSSQPRARRRLGDLATALSSRPREVVAFGPVRRALAPFVAEAAGSTVVVEFAGLAPLVSRRGPGQRWILTLHNLGSTMAAQEADVVAGRRQRWLHRRDAAAAARWEQAIVRRYDRVIAVSEADARVLDAAGGRNVAIVPNGVDLGGGPPEPLPPVPSVVFTGALYTGPNHDGIVWFCRKVWPLVRRDVPAATLIIVGARPGPDILQLAGRDGVEVHADVASVRPFLDQARVAVVPLRVGSGTRLKALEAFAAGRPVVGTTIGLDGLGLVPDRHAAFADGPDQLAGAVVRALTDDRWSAELASEGRQLVEDRYAWDAIGSLFADTVLGTAPDPVPGRH